MEEVRPVHPYHRISASSFASWLDPCLLPFAGDLGGALLAILEAFHQVLLLILALLRPSLLFLALKVEPSLYQQELLPVCQAGSRHLEH